MMIHPTTRTDAFPGSPGTIPVRAERPALDLRRETTVVLGVLIVSSTLDFRM